jgi:NAD(P)-dependent dehydrogenase (short-subunit alcohol dehydrogenase family)
MRWFVTGAGGGLGRVLTEHVLRRGDHVVATARRPAALDDLRAEFGDRLAVDVLDVTRPDQVEEVVARALAGGPVDVVVNNAGYGLVGATEETTVAQMREQVETLLLGPMVVTRAFLRPMREQGGGRIIQISSMGGQVGSPVFSAYHAGKWGLEGFTEGVSQEVAEHGIHLTIVEPGAVRTGFAAALRIVPETAPYRDGAVGRMRRAMAALDDAAMTGDPVRVAELIYATTRRPDPPLRLTLGTDAYDAVHAALGGRLAALEAQRDVAASVAFPARP